MAKTMVDKFSLVRGVFMLTQVIICLFALSALAGPIEEAQKKQDNAMNLLYLKLRKAKTPAERESALMMFSAAGRSVSDAIAKENNKTAATLQDESEKAFSDAQKKRAAGKMKIEPLKGLGGKNSGKAKSNGGAKAVKDIDDSSSSVEEVSAPKPAEYLDGRGLERELKFGRKKGEPETTASSLPDAPVGDGPNAEEIVIPVTAKEKSQDRLRALKEKLQKAKTPQKK
jgi:hypothetical protein